MTQLDRTTIPPVTGPQSGPVGTQASTQPESGNILELIDEVDAQDAEFYPYWQQRYALRSPIVRAEGRIGTAVFSLTGSSTPSASSDGELYQIAGGSGSVTLTLPARSDVDDEWNFLLDTNGNTGVVLRAVGSDRIFAAGANVGALNVTFNSPDNVVKVSRRAAGGFQYEDADLPGDMIPNASMFARARARFTHFTGWATYQDDALDDHAAIGRAEFDEMMLLPTRNLVSEEIVNPGPDTLWHNQIDDTGFDTVTAVTIPVVQNDDQVVFDEPGVHVSRAMMKMCQSYGGRADLVCGPELCNALRTARSTDGARGVGFPDLMLRRVVEQSFGFGVQPGDLLGIVGNFNPATVKVAWRERPHVIHAQTGTQFLEYRGTARVAAKYALAVISPVAFVRLIAG